MIISCLDFNVSCLIKRLGTKYCGSLSYRTQNFDYKIETYGFRYKKKKMIFNLNT